MKDRVCVVTGAASGIGRATALRLAGRGAVVVAIDIDETGLKELADEIAVDVHAVDVADGPAVYAAIAAVAAQHGRIDSCLTFAAVVANWGPPAELDDALWSRALEVNLRGTARVCAAAVPHMPAGSSIVTCSSIAGGLKPSPARSPYTAAKAGVVAHTRDLAVAYGPRGIRANALIPGFIETPMSHALVRGHEAAAAAEQTRIPLRRLGRADEVAEAALFLADDRSSYINGTTLVVDGGLSLV